MLNVRLSNVEFRHNGIKDPLDGPNKENELIYCITEQSFSPSLHENDLHNAKLLQRSLTTEYRRTFRVVYVLNQGILNPYANKNE
ncbi:10047_t:CDS:2, partial [Gigaspora rosea]